MKTLFRTGLLAGLFCTTLGAAQGQALANGDFETWATRNAVDSPTGWLTTDDVVKILSPIPFVTGTFTKATDAHGGTYAARLESKNTLFGILPGAVAVGTKVGTNATLPGGIPFTGRPTMLQFYYKLSGPQPTGSDGAFAQVALTRYVNGATQTLATAKQLFTTVTSTYVLAQVPLTYTSSATPDSVHLVLSSGAIITTTAGPVVGTVFQVDDVSFTGTVTATRDAALSAALTVAPNPSPDGRYLLHAPPTLLAGALAVTDATGRVVRREAALATSAPTRALDLSGLAAGFYTLQLLANQGLVTKKLVVE
ncbi:T9SS type A sorting domain-containing protein [Hymenobacter sp. UV11]|uniref:T9SS type A sorting domain-containing protein n=1 Tax=Hymenobacter sp. UV11 TaxID=1849735 RepID=UPI00105DF270|nr:T9SS type A sorting domain-containing protein [Hymenobacter sp. UV11]TDN37121.1 hypothetical protein A8B98_05165 [Hymenobacter sp. UV11]TFZ67758.1 T9SS type A sorting domain-containing protein [Hymenobacter sp. UV11]